MDTDTEAVSYYGPPRDVTTAPPEPRHDAMVTAGGGFSPVYVVIILPCTVIIIIMTIIVVYVMVTRLDETVHRRRETPGDWDCCHQVERISFHDEDSLDERLADINNMTEGDATEMVTMTTPATSGSREHIPMGEYGDYFGVQISNGPVTASQASLPLTHNRCYNHSNHDNQTNNNHSNALRPKSKLEYTVHECNTDYGYNGDNDIKAHAMDYVAMETAFLGSDDGNDGDEGRSLCSDDGSDGDEGRSLLTTNTDQPLQTKRSLSKEVLNLDRILERNASRRSSRSAERNRYLAVLAES